ncbi:MAG: LysR family transcriptional regulator [Nitrospinae bacterium]|nr:LysR family transcriptional regulator [Nitrospinota bacterium]
MSKSSNLKCRSRYRILSGDQIALGPGKVDLLESIDQVGSLSEAARQNHISYRRAWDMVNIMNQCFKKPLVESVTGGKGGGGAKLTPLGKKIINLYREMETKASLATQEEWKSLKKHLNP